MPQNLRSTYINAPLAITSANGVDIKFIISNSWGENFLGRVYFLYLEGIFWDETVQRTNCPCWLWHNPAAHWNTDSSVNVFLFKFFFFQRNLKQCTQTYTYCKIVLQGVRVELECFKQKKWCWVSSETFQTELYSTSSEIRRVFLLIIIMVFRLDLRVARQVTFNTQQE